MTLKITPIIFINAICILNTHVFGQVPAEGDNRACIPQPVHQVTICGYLSERYHLNEQYLLWQAENNKEFMCNPYLHPGQVKDRPWDGEYLGKWLDAASLTAQYMGDDQLMDLCSEYALVLINNQDSNGYIGIETPGNWNKNTWDIWNQWYSLWGLLTYYECFKDKTALESAVRAGEWIVSNHGPIENSNAKIYRGPWHGGCNVDIMDQMMRLYSHTGNKKFIEFAQSLSNHYVHIQNMRNSGTPFLTHAYVLLAYLGGNVLLNRIDRNKMELTWMEKIWEETVSRHLFPTYSLGSGETLHDVSPDDIPNSRIQETCATVEWLVFNQRLYESTGNIRYAHMTENIIYNALLSAQSSDGMKWMYYTPLRYEKKWMSGATFCCYWSGPRGISRIPQCIYRVDPDGICVNLFEHSEAKLYIKDSQLTIYQKTNYPRDGEVKLRLRMNRPLEFTLRMRIPEWTRNAIILLNNGEMHGTIASGEYASIRRVWKNGDTIVLKMDMPLNLVYLNKDNAAVRRGPEILSVDERDNQGIDLNAIALLDSSSLKFYSGAANGRTRCQILVKIGEKYGYVQMIPFAEAGNGGARFRTVFPVSRKAGKSVH